MKFITFACLTIFTIGSCFSQKETDYHPIVLKAKETSLYTDQVDWEEVSSTFNELVQDGDNAENLKKGLQYLLNSLGDKHASIRSAKDHSIIVYYTGEKEGEDNRLSSYVNTVINDISARFSYKLLENNIGYLRVVGIGPGNVKEPADQIRNGLVALNAKGVDKWLLDLRYNGGGNVEPMIAGLAPLIGEGFVGGAINKDKEIRDYIIENDQFSNYGRLVCEMPANPEIAPDEKVAVLLSRYTTSSGEMVAISFKGRENTRFIGEASSGYTTGNGYDMIDDELLLVISQDVFIDRNKKRYDNKVDVDDYIEFQHNTDMANDMQIKKAIEWLKN